MKEYISHPGEIKNGEAYGKKLLKDHLSEVGLNAAETVSKLELDDGRGLPLAAFIAGALHDFGKYTDYFQEHIRNPQTRSGKLSRHSLLSSVYGAFIASKAFGTDSHFHMITVYMAIAHHHGNLKTPTENFGDISIEDISEITDMGIASRIDTLTKQISNMKSNQAQIQNELTEVLSLGSRFGIGTQPLLSEFFEGAWIETINSLVDSYCKLTGNQGSEFPFIHYFDIMLVYSALLDGDKKSASRMGEYERAAIPENAVGAYVDCISPERVEKRITDLRKATYDRTARRIKEYNSTGGIYTLSAPTGSGKTLAAINSALHLARLGVRPSSSRIIYCLPFTSIIDQVYSVLDSLLSTAPEYSYKRQRYLLKHHHLAELDTKIDNENIPLDYALSLAESWDSEIIVTTFVQFFETLVGNKNRRSRKYNKIANSIVILDEVQSLNVDMWPFIRVMLKEATRYLNVHFILMTATQPLILNSDDTHELGYSKEEYKELLRNFSRSRIELCLDTKTEDEIADLIAERIRNSSSVLVIRNTVRLSIDTFNKCKELLEENNETFLLYYLSTNIIPKARSSRIELIKQALEDGKKVLVVSTQVVEAGVDLDFDSVIRDIGPIDSIIQAAGRCNRNGNSDTSTATIINTEQGVRGVKKYSPLHTYVYGKIHMDVAWKILSSSPPVIDEMDYPEILESYFKEISERHYNDIPEDEIPLVDSIKKLRFTQDAGGNRAAISQFSIIEDSPERVDFFVVLDDGAEEIMKWFEGLGSEQDPFKRKSMFAQRKSEFHSYVMSVDIRRAESLGASRLGTTSLYIMERELSSQYYDENTGLAMEDTHSSFF